MKRLAIVLTSLLLLACSKQDTATDYIIGTWQLTRTIDEKFDLNGNLTKRLETAIAWDERLSFSSNGSYIHYKKGENFEHSYTYDKKQQQLLLNEKTYSVEELTDTSLIICSQTIYSDSFGKGYVYNRKCWKKVK